MSKSYIFVRVNVAHMGKNLISNRRMVRICLSWLEGALELVLKQMILSYAARLEVNIVYGSFVSSRTAALLSTT